MTLSRCTIFPVALLLMFLCVSIGHGASIKERMATRIPAINSLKDSGIIGENNAGYLEYRTGNKPQQQLIAEENADRKTVYRAIGEKQGASAELVGKRRALQIAERGKSGHWFQKPDGAWFKK